MKSTVRRLIIPLALAALVLTGCSGIPRDPDGTLDRVRSSGVLRVGASPSEGLVDISGEQVTGPEADLATSFAEANGARVEWHPGGEEELVTAMEEGELDLLIGGLSHQSPWTTKVALTRPYATREGDGGTIKQVMAVPMGENAFLAALETFLDGRS